jgi:hypothetical protein
MGFIKGKGIIRRGQVDCNFSAKGTLRMITIRVNNAEELATKQKGWFQVFVGKTFGVDIQREVEEEVAKQIKAELAKQGVKARVSVK